MKHRAWRRLLAAAALAAALPAAAQVRDLLDAYAAARAGDPVLRAADANLRAVGEGVAQARAPLLPQASAAVGLAQTHGPDANANDASIRSRDVGATLSQTLIDFAQLSRLSYAKARDRAEQSTYRAAEQALSTRVATAYFDVLTAIDLLATTEANEAAYGQQVTQSDQRYRSGLVAMVDVDQACAYEASARAATIAARKTLDDALAALAEVTGVRFDRLKTLQRELPLLPPQPADPQAWVEAALRDNPLIAAQRRNVEAAGHLVDVARAGHLPTISANVDVDRPATWPGGDFTGRDGRTVTTVGVLLRIPLFAGGLTQSSVRQALALRDVGDADLETLRRRVTRETLDHYSDVVAALGQIEANKTAVEAATKALASTRVGQQVGTQTMTDLLLAIQTLSSAQSAYSQARHRFVLSQLLLRQSAGRIGEADLRLVNALLQ